MVRLATGWLHTRDGWGSWEHTVRELLTQMDPVLRSRSYYTYLALSYHAYHFQLLEEEEEEFSEIKQGKEGSDALGD